MRTSSSIPTAKIEPISTNVFGRTTNRWRCGLPGDARYGFPGRTWPHYPDKCAHLRRFQRQRSSQSRQMFLAEQRTVGDVVCPGTQGTAFLVGHGRIILTNAHIFVDSNGKDRANLDKCFWQNNEPLAMWFARGRKVRLSWSDMAALS